MERIEEYIIEIESAVDELFSYCRTPEQDDAYDALVREVHHFKRVMQEGDAQ